jgi:hypothetical protein
MNSDKSHSARHKRQFSGCIELIPPQPKFIEFVTDNRLCGIPLHQLDYFILGSVPKQFEKKDGPPDLLILIFTRRIVVLFGWRLELMVGPLVNGQIARVHAEKHLGPLMIEEAWVSEIKISPRFDPGQM